LKLVYQDIKSFLQAEKRFHPDRFRKLALRVAGTPPPSRFLGGELSQGHQGGGDGNSGNEADPEEWMSADSIGFAREEEASGNSGGGGGEVGCDLFSPTGPAASFSYGGQIEVRVYSATLSRPVAAALFTLSHHMSAA